jgi:hypothetical protein
MLIPCSQSKEHHDEWLALEGRVRKKENLIHDPAVQRLLKTAHNTFNEWAYRLSVERLQLILKVGNINEMRKPDEFRPYCPASLSRSGNLHLIDQMDGIPIFINHHKFVTGLGIFGPQGAGKSYAIIDFCGEIRRIDPNIKITIVDPKGAFSNLASFLHIDMMNASFDLMPPSNAGIENFNYELMPILADTAGLIYSLDMLYQAADIAFGQRRHYMGQTGIDPGICLKDIRESLNLIKVSGFRKMGYHDAATTAMSLILGKQNLFACRKGISLDWLFCQNAVLNARCLTDDMQCRFFAIYLLYWLYQRSRYNPETNQIKHIIIIDDASRFIGAVGNQFDGHSKTSPLGHILAVLRSAGICFVYATQLPSQVDPAVLSLTRNGLVIGNINGESNLNVIRNMMSLTYEKTAAIPRFKTRETLVFISGHDWPHPIHGWTPTVNISDYTTANPLKAAIDITPWHSLNNIPQQQTTETVTPPAHINERQNSAAAAKAASSVSDSIKVKGSTDKLVLDCIHYPFDKASDHAAKLDSIREYDAAKTEAVQNGLLIESQCGKPLYLIPTQAAYDKFGIVNPYQRATSVEHAFYVRLAASILKKQSGLTIHIETPVGAKGATIDVTTVDKSGNMIAYEITLSTSNLSSNASKLQDTAYKKIVWLSRDADTSKAVTAYFNKSASLPPELTSKFECVHFSKWISQMKKRKE